MILLGLISNRSRGTLSSNRLVDYSTTTVGIDIHKYGEQQ